MYDYPKKEQELSFSLEHGFQFTDSTKSYVTANKFDSQRACFSAQKQPPAVFL